ncbi:restriction endonuclease subunit S [Anaerococcus jeddahensis]|uniref:restriction endonuclease subunit S n=1 Tax=Anaerococcus jeddahensis TaxID=1673719 RepID=UPI0006724625|nr:restriction endonuclease subunit S [Anaerococcus jeddahensis]
MSWEKKQIGELVSLRQGFAINKKTNHHMSEEPTQLHLLRIGDMKDGNFSVFVRDTIPEKFIAEESDIIYTRTGQVGLVFRNQHGVVHNNCFTVTSNDESILNQQYLYYALQENSFYEEANSRATGAAQPDLPHSAFNSIEVYLPPIETQYKIVSVLDSYNWLIENNKEQIKLLEEAAQRIYKEWFVDLHFPGYEDVEIVDGLPEGWKNVSLRNMISFDIGGGWGEENIKEKSEKPAYVIRGTDLYGITHGDMSSIPFRYHTESNLSSRILQEGDIVFEVSGGSKTEGVARTLLITKEMLESYGSPVICASFCKLVRINELPYSQYMYDTFQFLRSSGKTTEFDKKSASSIVNYRWKDFLAQQNILVPPHSILDTYNCIAESLYHQIINHSKQIESLKNARDRLLPKLMSGEIEV